MAQRTITQLVDDIDGKELQQGSGETVTFGLDGVTYEIDLSDANAKKLRDAFSTYVGHARRISSGTRASSSRSSNPGANSTKRDPSQTQAIKSWAKENGHKVAERGRISQSVIDAYEAAH